MYIKIYVLENISDIHKVTHTQIYFPIPISDAVAKHKKIFYLFCLLLSLVHFSIISVQDTERFIHAIWIIDPNLILQVTW